MNAAKPSLLRPAQLKIERDLNGAIWLEVVGGGRAMMTPDEAIKIGAHLLRTAGCSLDFRLAGEGR